MPYAPDSRDFYDADSHIMELPNFLKDYADPKLRDDIYSVSYSASLVTDEEVAEIMGNGGKHSSEHVAQQIALGDELIAKSKEIQALGAFNAGDRITALDMLGFGYSDKPNVSTYSIHGQADIVEALVTARSLGQFHILAHDYGDTVTQELLARHQKGAGAGQLLSCCFLNGGLFPETHRALLTQKLLLSPFGALVNKFAGYKQFSKNFSSVFGNKTKPAEAELIIFWQLINEKDGKHIFHNLITYMRDRKLHRERWVGALQQSTIPLALINGSLDPVSGAHMVARYRELGCRLDYLGELASIGHYPQVEDSAAVIEHFYKFIDAQK